MNAYFHIFARLASFRWECCLFSLLGTKGDRRRGRDGLAHHRDSAHQREREESSMSSLHDRGSRKCLTIF